MSSLPADLGKIVLPIAGLVVLGVLTWWVWAPLKDLMRQLEIDDLPLLILVAVLTFANLALSVFKFNLLSEHRVGWAPGIAATSAGALLGQVMPVQLAISTTRAFAARFAGNRASLAAATSAHEQVFDVVIVLSAAAAALVWTIAGVWPGMVTFVAIPVLLLLFFYRIVDGAASILKSRPGVAAWLRQAALSPSKTQALLLAASCLRYGLTLIRALVILQVLGYGAAAPLAAAAYPLIQIAGSAPLTPGGLGLVEASWMAVLTGSGFTIVQAATFAVAMRLIVVVSQAVVCAGAAAMTPKSSR